MKKKKNSAKGVIIAIVMICLVVGYYFYLSNRTVKIKETAPAKFTAYDNVVLRDLSIDYPPSPKEVVKYYAEITKCFYDKGYTDDELRKLALKSRELFDDELKANQSDEDYLNNLKLDVADYAKNDRKISSYSVSSSVDVKYSTVDSRDMAGLHCIYSIRQGTQMISANHEFVLRKDETGHWKILGWSLSAEGANNG